MGTEALCALIQLDTTFHGLATSLHIKTHLQEWSASILQGDGEELQDGRGATFLSCADESDGAFPVIACLGKDTVYFIRTFRRWELAVTYISPLRPWTRCQVCGC